MLSSVVNAVAQKFIEPFGKNDLQLSTKDQFVVKNVNMKTEEINALLKKSGAPISVKNMSASMMQLRSSLYDGSITARVKDAEITVKPRLQNLLGAKNRNNVQGPKRNRHTCNSHRVDNHHTCHGDSAYTIPVRGYNGCECQPIGYGSAHPVRQNLQPIMPQPQYMLHDNNENVYHSAPHAMQQYNDHNLCNCQQEEYDIDDMKYVSHGGDMDMLKLHDVMGSQTERQYTRRSSKTHYSRNHDDNHISKLQIDNIKHKGTILAAPTTKGTILVAPTTREINDLQQMGYVLIEIPNKKKSKKKKSKGSKESKESKMTRYSADTDMWKHVKDTNNKPKPKNKSDGNLRTIHLSAIEFPDQNDLASKQSHIDSQDTSVESPQRMESRPIDVRTSQRRLVSLTNTHDYKQKPDKFETESVYIDHTHEDTAQESNIDRSKAVERRDYVANFGQDKDSTIYTHTTPVHTEKKVYYQSKEYPKSLSQSHHFVKSGGHYRTTANKKSGLDVPSVPCTVTTHHTVQVGRRPRSKSPRQHRTVEYVDHKKPRVYSGCVFEDDEPYKPISGVSSATHGSRPYVEHKSETMMQNETELSSNTESEFKEFSKCVTKKMESSTESSKFNTSSFSFVRKPDSSFVY